MDLVLFLLGTIGLTHIIVDSKIVAPVRDWLAGYGWARLHTLVLCYQCCRAHVRFWLGLLCWLNPVLAGGATSFLALLGASFINCLTPVTLPSD
jgi:hypothetical protein